MSSLSLVYKSAGLSGAGHVHTRHLGHWDWSYPPTTRQHVTALPRPAVRALSKRRGAQASRSRPVGSPVGSPVGPFEMTAREWGMNLAWRGAYHVHRSHDHLPQRFQLDMKVWYLRFSQFGPPAHEQVTLDGAGRPCCCAFLGLCGVSWNAPSMELLSSGSSNTGECRSLIHGDGAGWSTELVEESAAVGFSRDVMCPPVGLVFLSRSPECVSAARVSSLYRSIPRGPDPTTVTGTPVKVADRCLSWARSDKTSRSTCADGLRSDSGQSPRVVRRRNRPGS